MTIQESVDDILARLKHALLQRERAAREWERQSNQWEQRWRDVTGERDELRARIDHYLAERDISDLMHDVQIQERAATRRWARLWKRGMQAQMRACGYWRDEARRAEQECAELRANAALAVERWKRSEAIRKAAIDQACDQGLHIEELEREIATLRADVAATCRAALGEQHT